MLHKIFNYKSLLSIAVLLLSQQSCFGMTIGEAIAAAPKDIQDIIGDTNLEEKLANQVALDNVATSPWILPAAKSGADQYVKYQFIINAAGMTPAAATAAAEKLQEANIIFSVFDPASIADIGTNPDSKALYDGLKAIQVATNNTDLLAAYTAFNDIAKMELVAKMRAHRFDEHATTGNSLNLNVKRADGTNVTSLMTASNRGRPPASNEVIQAYQAIGATLILFGESTTARTSLGESTLYYCLNSREIREQMVNGTLTLCQIIIDVTPEIANTIGLVDDITAAGGGTYSVVDIAQANHE